MAETNQPPMNAGPLRVCPDCGGILEPTEPRWTTMIHMAAGSARPQTSSTALAVLDLRLPQQLTTTGWFRITSEPRGCGESPVATRGDVAERKLVFALVAHQLENGRPLFIGQIDLLLLDVK